MDIVPVTKSRDENTTEGIDMISPVVIFSFNTYKPGYMPITKKNKEIKPKNFSGFTFIKIKSRDFEILIPSLNGSSFVPDPFLTL